MALLTLIIPTRQISKTDTHSKNKKNKSSYTPNKRNRLTRDYKDVEQFGIHFYTMFYLLNPAMVSLKNTTFNFYTFKNFREEKQQKSILFLIYPVFRMLSRPLTISEQNKFRIKCFKPRGRVSSFFHSGFSPLSNPAGGSNPAGQTF